MRPEDDRDLLVQGPRVLEIVDVRVFEVLFPLVAEEAGDWRPAEHDGESGEEGVEGTLLRQDGRPARARARWDVGIAGQRKGRARSSRGFDADE